MALHTICRADELGIGTIKSFSVAGKKIALYHLTDGFFATQASCSHVFAPLARGKLIADSQVQCPFHRACFDVRTGKVVQWANFPPGIQLLNAVRGAKDLRTFKVVLNDGTVSLDLPS